MKQIRGLFCDGQLRLYVEQVYKALVHYTVQCTAHLKQTDENNIVKFFFCLRLPVFPCFIFAPILKSYVGIENEHITAILFFLSVEIVCIPNPKFAGKCEYFSVADTETKL